MGSGYLNSWSGGTLNLTLSSECLLADVTVTNPYSSYGWYDNLTQFSVAVSVDGEGAEHIIGKISSVRAQAGGAGVGMRGHDGAFRCLYHVPETGIRYVRNICKYSVFIHFCNEFTTINRQSAVRLIGAGA